MRLLFKGLEGDFGGGEVLEIAKPPTPKKKIGVSLHEKYDFPIIVTPNSSPREISSPADDTIDPHFYFQEGELPDGPLEQESHRDVQAVSVETHHIQNPFISTSIANFLSKPENSDVYTALSKSGGKFVGKIDLTIQAEREEARSTKKLPMFQALQAFTKKIFSRSWTTVEVAQAHPPFEVSPKRVDAYASAIAFFLGHHPSVRRDIELFMKKKVIDDAIITTMREKNASLEDIEEALTNEATRYGMWRKVLAKSHQHFYIGDRELSRDKESNHIL